MVSLILIGAGRDKETNPKDNLTRRRLQKIIKQNDDKLMAKHSKIIGIGIRKTSNRYMHCNVLLRQKFGSIWRRGVTKESRRISSWYQRRLCYVRVFYEYVSLSTVVVALEYLQTTLLGLLFCFFVRSKYNHADSGDIKAAHVALERNYFTGLYENEALLSQHLFPATYTHEIVQQPNK